MLTSKMGDSAGVPGSEMILPQMDLVVELEVAICDCCGLSEECTLSYIQAIRERYGGKWICGLCAEAVKDEASRKVISADEAMARHSSFCSKFRGSGPPADTALHLIQALSQFLRKGIMMDTPKSSTTTSG